MEDSKMESTKMEDYALRLALSIIESEHRVEMTLFNGIQIGDQIFTGEDSIVLPGNLLNPIAYNISPGMFFNGVTLRVKFDTPLVLLLEGEPDTFLWEPVYTFIVTPEGVKSIHIPNYNIPIPFLEIPESLRK